MSAGHVTQIDDLRSLVAEFEQLKSENEDLRRANESLQKQVGSMLAKLKKYKPFEPFLSDLPTEMVVEIRNEAIIQQLLARTAQVYGKRFNLETETEGERDLSRKYVDNVVLACLRYGLVENHRWHDLYRRYLRQ